MAEAPSGTVTLLFSDIEGSTKLLKRAGGVYAGLLDEHRRLLRAAFDANSGYEVDTDGDAFFVAFPSANEAVAAAAEAQQALARHQWPTNIEIRVRMGVHTGEPRLIEGRYVGLDVHRAARVMAAGHGGQVVISHSTRDLLDEHLTVRDLGEHRLKDLSEPQRLYQLQVEGLPHEFPALKTLENRPTNLPVQPTPLIGRERELDEIERLLRREDVHLLTMTGAGGTGKTRLALQVAADLIEHYPNGVFFVSLAPISDPDLVVPTIAHALALREQGGEPLIETLRDYLCEKEMLLLLDNFEQVLAAAPTVSALRSAAPGLGVLATSRTPLRLSGERTYPVSPLPLPDPARLPDAAALTQYPSVSLFIERAQAASPDFTLSSENALAIAEICVRLDGLPLALELAAARVRVLSPQALLSRLDQRLKLLTGGAHDLDERQRTMRATIEWSYELLSREEKTLFARLGVFVGGCRLDSAEAVCDSEGDLGVDIFDGLTSLVEKSLLRHKEDPDGEPRFWILETIREYAIECLSTLSDAERARSAHAEFYLDVAQEAKKHFHDEHAAAALIGVEQERENFRAAMSWLEETSKGDLLLRLAAALGEFWSLRSELREGRRWLDSALAYEDGAPAVREEALKFAFWVAAQHGDIERARMLVEQRSANAEVLGDPAAVLGSVDCRAHLAYLMGDLEQMTSLQVEAVGIARTLGDARALATNVLNLGGAYEVAGDYVRARAALEEALALDRERGDRGDVAHDLHDLGWIAIHQEDFDEAQGLFTTALPVLAELGRRDAVARALGGLAAVAVDDADFVRAARLKGAADSLLFEIGGRNDAHIDDERERYIERPLRERADHDLRQARDEGNNMTPDQAVGYALREKPAPASTYADPRTE